MFATPGLLALIFLEYLRPQEYFQSLATFPVLYVAAGLALFGFVLDLRLGQSRGQPAPHLFLTLVFFTWALVTVAANAPGALGSRATILLIALAMYLLIAHGVQGFRMLEAIAALLLAVALFLAFVGIEQGLSPYGCHRVTLGSMGQVYQYDGRPCPGASRHECEDEEADPGAEYACERVGLLGTQSIAGRVRYRGTLQDPNELALVLGIAMPFAFAFFDRRRTTTRLVLVVVTVVMVGLAMFFTGSRGGQLVFVSVLGVYFVRRVGVAKGLALGAALALPILLFGGRTGAVADSSTEERIECWSAGLHMLAWKPGIGVGNGQFSEHHILTAHNSFILVSAEMGLVGMLLWTSIVYIALKIPVQALKTEGLAPVAQSWSVALLAAVTGLVVGAFFLSYAYKDVFWLFIGLTGILYHAIRRHHPGFEVRFGVRDLLVVGAVDVVLTGLLFVYLWRKVGW